MYIVTLSYGRSDRPALGFIDAVLYMIGVLFLVPLALNISQSAGRWFRMDERLITFHAKKLSNLESSKIGVLLLRTTEKMEEITPMAGAKPLQCIILFTI